MGFFTAPMKRARRAILMGVVASTVPFSLGFGKSRLEKEAL